MRVPINVPDDHIAGCIQGAHSRYWCSGVTYRKPEPVKGLRWYRVTIREELKDPKHPARSLSRTNICLGLVICAEKYPSVFAHVMDGNYDGPDGDVLLQCIVFGEVVYG